MLKKKMEPTKKNVSEGSCDNEDWSNDAENPASRQ